MGDSRAEFFLGCKAKRVNIDFEKPKDYSLKIKTLLNLQFDFKKS